MYKKIKDWLSKPSHNSTNDRVDMTSPYSSAQVTLRIKETDIVKSQLAEFMGNNIEGTTFVSLGENCSSAWYLKQIGLKEASYPFDWIFSSPEIVLDCINDNFKKYLNRKFIIPKRNNTSAGHSYYHENLFNHRNPLSSEDDYRYLQRCCNRFIEILESQNSCCYLITLINEPSKRPGWANGFTKTFSMPKNQNLETVSKLIKGITDRNKESKFIIIDHYTNSELSTTSRKVSDDVFFIEFHANAKSTGVFYVDPLDDFCFKQALVGLYGKPKNT